MPTKRSPSPDYRIPILNTPPDVGTYHDVPFDANDPRSSEPLVKLEDYGIACENFYARDDGKNWPYNAPIEGATRHVWCRRAVAEKLVKINQRLESIGTRVVVLDAYRSVACQQGLWTFFDRQTQRDMPNATAEERKQTMLKIVSDPTRFNRDDPTTWPVHACGGAVDVTLEEIASGHRLDMGGRFDELSPIVYTDAYERRYEDEEISETHPALVNRRILHQAMTREGFVNYPLEFWHFDFGDQMHVFHAQELRLADAPRSAWYGYTESPEPVEEICPLFIQVTLEYTQSR
ncbi:MAG: M15 family metallopeptidase [Bdellovibrionales bacterium]